MEFDKWKTREDTLNGQTLFPNNLTGILFLFLRSVAAWFDAPDTQFLLDFIRPDFLLLRVRCAHFYDFYARLKNYCVWKPVLAS